MNSKTLIAPRVHLNGDTRETLQESIYTAACAVREAEMKLREAHPNARNFYVIGPDAFERARNEHADRVNRVSDVYAELVALYGAIDANEIETKAEVTQ